MNIKKILGNFICLVTIITVYTFSEHTKVFAQAANCSPPTPVASTSFLTYERITNPSTGNTAIKITNYGDEARNGTGTYCPYKITLVDKQTGNTVFSEVFTASNRLPNEAYPYIKIVDITPGDYEITFQYAQVDNGNLVYYQDGASQQLNVETIEANPTPNLVPTINEGGGGPSVDQTLQLLKDSISKIYLFIFPIAIVILIIKILISIITITTSGGDPNNLNKAKEELFATLTGFLLIAGAVTLINILGNALGI